MQFLPVHKCPAELFTIEIKTLRRNAQRGDMVELNETEYLKCPF
jgi:hypothetical protein